MTKYLTALLMAAAAAILVWTATVMTQPSPRLAMPGADPAPAPQAASAALARIAQLEASLAQLHRMNGIMPRSPLALAADNATAALGAGEQSAVAQASVEPQVSLVYLAPGKQLAAINGELVAPGAKLANGDRVLSIDANRVLLQSGSRRVTLQVPAPQVVGGVYGQTRGTVK